MVWHGNSSFHHIVIRQVCQSEFANDYPLVHVGLQLQSMKITRWKGGIESAPTLWQLFRALQWREGECERIWNKRVGKSMFNQRKESGMEEVEWGTTLTQLLFHVSDNNNNKNNNNSDNSDKTSPPGLLLSSSGTDSKNNNINDSSTTSPPSLFQPRHSFSPCSSSWKSPLWK